MRYVGASETMQKPLLGGRLSEHDSVLVSIMGSPVHEDYHMAESRSVYIYIYIQGTKCLDSLCLECCHKKLFS